MNVVEAVHWFELFKLIAQFETAAEPLNELPDRVAASLEREFATLPAGPLYVPVIVGVKLSAFAVAPIVSP